MITKIQEFIEDNTSMDVTRNQVILGLVVLGSLIILILFMMFGSNGPKETPDYVSKPPINDPINAD